jgi:hypothetical protein
MPNKSYVALSVFVCGLICFGLAFGQTGSPMMGQWTVGGPIIQDLVQLSIQRSTGRGSTQSSSMVPLTQLRGLTRAQLDSAGSMARFEVVRDAGTLQFQGYVQNGTGGGAFTFSPNPNFANEMRALGYSDLSDDRVFVLAIHDVRLAFVRDMQGLGLRPDSTDQIITMRIHNVTAEFVRELGNLGYSDLSPNKLVTMRIHGVTTDFAQELKSQGYNSASPDQMVTMRIHGVTTDFIREVEALGYSHPPIEQLVTMRIHGVTPEYIRKARSLGLGNLSIDRLVTLRIHGIVQ